jgi:hypothetical protein
VASTKALIPLVLSLALHVGAGVGARVWVEVRGADTPPRTEIPPDVWAGRGIELEESEEVTAETPASTPAVETPPVAPGEHGRTREPACVLNCSPANERDAPHERDATRSAPDAATKTSAPPRAVRIPPRAATPPRASATSTGTSASSPAAGAASTTSGALGQAFGAAGLPPGVRHLPRAYTRAISQGGWGVAGFRSAPPGRLCEARVSITIAEDRSIGPVDYGGDAEREAVPPLCRSLFENARRLLVNGEFSLDAASLTSGAMRLRITVEVSDGEPHDDAGEGPNGLFSESHEPAGAGRRGRSSFTLNSGRRVDAFVELE